MYKINNIRKVFSLEGSHAAFTDIGKFNGYYYLGFMLGVKHMVDKENKSMILKSKDGVNWTASSLLHCGIDTREPKFMEINGRFFAYFFTITPNEDKTRMITNSWYVYTDDGMIWTQPKQFAAEEKFWRPVFHKGMAYCVSHPKDPVPDRPCKLYKSADGMSWEFMADIPIDPMKKPTEASLDFDSHDNLFIFIRSDRGDNHSYVLKAEPPYTEFEVYDMGMRLGGPLLWIKNDEIFLGARIFTDYDARNTAILKLDDEMKPHMICILPSFGDCSYMGITEKMDGEGYFISYYSSHECLEGTSVSPNISSIYLADISGFSAERE